MTQMHSNVQPWLQSAIPRWQLVGGREKLAVILVLLIACGVAAAALVPGSACPSKLAELEAALDNSSQQLQMADQQGSQATKCSAYRKRVEVLSAVKPGTKKCAASLFSRMRAWDYFDTELALYRARVAQDCR